MGQHLFTFYIIFNTMQKYFLPPFKVKESLGVIVSSVCEFHPKYRPYFESQYKSQISTHCCLVLERLGLIQSADKHVQERHVISIVSSSSGVVLLQKAYSIQLSSRVTRLVVPNIYLTAKRFVISIVSNGVVLLEEACSSQLSSRVTRLVILNISLTPLFDTIV